MGVAYEVRDDIAFLSFDRREKHNALRDEDISALIDALARFDADDGAQVAILSGQGRSFSSGGDVNERLERSMEEGSTSGRTNEAGAFAECVNWKPVIAAVHGYCLGHAFGTALYCDHIVAGRDAVFQVTEIKYGLPTAAVVARMGGHPLAHEVAMTGAMFSAEQAWEAGILTRLVDTGKHLSAAEDLVRQILENPQWAVRQNVKIGRAVMRETVARHHAHSDSFDWASDPEARQAVAGVAEKMGRGD